MLRDVPLFGGAVDGIVDLISLFNTTDRAFLVAFLILIASGLLQIFWTHPNHRRFTASLRKAGQRLALIQRDSEATADDKLAKLATVFDDIPGLKARWRDYRTNLLIDDNHGRLVNLIDPRGWFAAEALPGRGYEKWAGTLAGVFLTIGLLFTFIGLSAALLKVGDVGNNTGALREAINEILRISSAKFITSIAGIIAFIHWSLVARHYIRAQSKAAATFAEAVQELSYYLTPETLLFEQRKIASKQLDRLDTFTDDLAIAVDKAVGQRLDALPAGIGAEVQKAVEATVSGRLDNMPSNLGDAIRTPLSEAMAPVTAALDRFGADLRTNTGDAMQKMLEEFVTKLQAGAGTQMTSVSDKIEELGKLLQTVQQQVDASGKNFSTDISLAAERLLAAATRMDESVSTSLADLSSKIGTISAALEGNATKLSNVGEQMTTGVAEGLKAASNALLEAAQRSGDETANAIKEQIGLLTGTMTSVATGITTAIEQTKASILEGGSGAAASLNAGADEAQKAITGAAQAIVEAADQATIRMTAVAQEIGNRIEQASAGLGRLSAGTDTQISRLDAAGLKVIEAGEVFSRAGTAVERTVTPLAASLQTIGRAVEQVRVAVEAHGEADASARKALDQLNALTKEATTMFSAQERRLGQFDGALEKTMLSLKQGVLDLGNEMSGAFKEYDAAMTRAVGTLKNAIEEFAEELEGARPDTAKTGGRR